MLKKTTLFILCGVLPLLIIAQQEPSEMLKPLTQEEYKTWKSVEGAEISNDGEYVLFGINPQREDGVLHILRLDDKMEVQTDRGANAEFSPENGFVVFKIEPQRDTVRQAKLDEKKKDEMPKDSLGILILGENEPTKYPNLISFKLPEKESSWLAYLLEETIEIEDTTAREDEVENPTDSIPSEDAEKEDEKVKTRKVKKLFITDPTDDEEYVFEHIEEYEIAENGESVLFLQVPEKSEEDTVEIKKLWYFDTRKEEVHLLDSLEGDFKNLSVSKNGDLFAWHFSADTTDVKTYDLFMHISGRNAQTLEINMQTENMPEGYAVSEHRKAVFSDNHERMLFGIAPEPKQEEEDTLLDEEKYHLDIWHWQDDLLQPMQKERAKQERERNFMTVFHLEERKMVPLANKEIPDVETDRYRNAEKMLATSYLPYAKEISWEGRMAQDLYAVNTQTGNMELITKKATSRFDISTAGNFVVYWDEKNRDWKSYSMKDGTEVNLTSAIDIPFYDEDNDIPAEPRPYGVAGWGKDDEFLLIYDKYDIWKLDPTGEEVPLNITMSMGRKDKIRFRYENLDPDVYYIPKNKIYLDAFHEKNKKSGYFTLDIRRGEMEELVFEDVLYYSLDKAKNEDRFIWRKSTFRDYPDLYTSTMEFTETEKLSDANPQQSEYRWGSVELVEWQDFNNDTLQGMLYLPENLDKSEKHPMIVYFYEKSSNGLHRYRSPSPSRSIINPSYCVSNGYIVFVPDITYTIGYPGQSAYEAIISGTQSMLERYDFIDREKMGLQGQSWGGYQIAYLVTQTNMFAAAMAGAPVSNMVSAYGGIRWGSGMSRQFQYEKTQSRLGGTLWEKPFRYIENSPVFFADKVQTPLLMMHNDDDGAVPWYQGIEYFVALRRLDKPVWMLVYNDEAHNLRKWPNRMDLDKRMYQFFDYYLKDAPAPVWIKEGRSFLDKEDTDAYELSE